MNQNRLTSNLKYFLHILIWIMCLFLVMILHHYLTTYIEWTPKMLARIDMTYHIIRIFFIATSISSVGNILLNSVRYGSNINHHIIRRFLPIIQFLLTMIIWVVSGFLMLEALNINTNSILAGAGIGGAIVVLASKDLLTNLLGSLSILFSRTFEIGDTIRIRMLRLEVEGLVEEITLNHTKLTNKTGEVVYVPNRKVYTESVENLSRRRFYTYSYLVPFAKNTPPKEVDLSMKIIEGKIASYYPIDVEYTAQNQNSGEYLYTIEVKLPEENEAFDEDMRKFLTSYIFHGRYVSNPKNNHIVDEDDENEM
ncbi:hypothetical protein CSB09_01420 [Candidatus Gracilibacteria bacterium]|nr:MAG: hypothetical protein CSB09_01420 [Candidatus Gracilibacteria bacterium]